MDLASGTRSRKEEDLQTWNKHKVEQPFQQEPAALNIEALPSLLN